MSASVTLKEVVRTPDIDVTTPLNITKNFGDGVAEVLSTTITNRCERREVLNLTVTHPCTRPEILQTTITYPCKIKEVIKATVTVPCGVNEILTSTVLTPCGIKEVLKTVVDHPCGIPEVIKATTLTPCGVKEVLDLNITSGCAIKEIIKTTITNPCGVLDTIQATITTPCGKANEVIQATITNGCAFSETLKTTITSPCKQVKDVLKATVNQGCGVADILKLTINTPYPPVFDTISATIDTPCGVKEVLKLTITSACYNASYIGIILRDGVEVDINLDPLVHTSSDLVAAAIRTAAFPGWIVSGTGSDIIWTATDAFVKTGMNYVFPNTTYVTYNGINIIVDSTINGNIAFSLRGAPAVFVYVDSNYQNTTTLVADEVRAAYFNGWTVSGSGNEIIWTAQVPGPKTGSNTFYPSAGVTSTINVLTDPFTGNIGITLRGTEVIVPVSSITDTTTNLIATKIRATTFSGWDISGIGSEIIFSALSTEVRSGTNSFNGYSTGVTSTSGVTIFQDSYQAGNIGIILRGGTQVNIPVNTRDFTTTVSIANAIRAATYSSDWVVSGTDNDIIWTSTFEGTRAGINSYIPGNTGSATSLTIQTVVFTGNIGISLRSEAAINIAVNSTNHYTTDLVAATVRATAFPGWVTSGTGSDIIWTATDTSIRNGNESFIANDTGITSSGIIETQNSLVSSKIGIILRSGTEVTIPIDSATHYTANLVAQAISNVIFSGWNVTRSNNIITFTATTNEYRSGSDSINFYSTGVSGSIIETVSSFISGNVGITLRGTIFNTVINSTHTTTDLVAAAIRTTSFSGWNVSGTGSNIIWTATTLGARVGTNNIVANNIGVTGTIAITQDSSVSGSIIVSLRNGSNISIPVSSVNQYTTDLVAATVRVTTFPGWVTSGTGSDIIWTATVAEYRTGNNNFNFGNTGVTSSGFTILVDSYFTGTVDITVRNNLVTVPVNSKDQGTANDLASAIRAAIFTNYTVNGSNGLAEFTSTIFGPITGTNLFNPYSTGAIGSFSVNTVGVSSGNVGITIRGLTVLTAIDSITQGTSDLVADAIVANAAAFLPSWIVTKGSVNEVIFTANVIGVRPGINSFNSNGTGATGTMTIIQDGHVVGNVGVSLRGGAVINTVVDSGLQTTNELTAAAIANTNFPNWVTSVSGAEVTWTATNPGYRGISANTINVNATGVTATGGVTIFVDGFVTGNVGVSLRGGSAVNTSVNSRDQGTLADVAAKIATSSFPGWVATSSGAIVKWTATDTTVRSGVSSITSSEGTALDNIVIVQDSLAVDNVGIILRGQTVVNTQLRTDTHRTINLVAAALAASTYPNWVASVSGNIITFTATVEEVRYGDNSSVNFSSSGTTTGAIGSLSIYQNGYIEETVSVGLHGFPLITTKLNSKDHSTTDLVAAALRSSSSYDWTMTGTGSNVIYTAGKTVVATVVSANYGIMDLDGNLSGPVITLSNDPFGNSTGVVTVTTKKIVINRANVYFQSSITISIIGFFPINLTVDSKNQPDINSVAAAINATSSSFSTSCSNNIVYFVVADESLRPPITPDSFVSVSSLAELDSHNHIPTISATQSHIQDSYFSGTFGIILRNGPQVNVNVNSTSHRTNESVITEIATKNFSQEYTTITGYSGFFHFPVYKTIGFGWKIKTNGNVITWRAKVAEVRCYNGEINSFVQDTSSPTVSTGNVISVSTGNVVIVENGLFDGNFQLILRGNTFNIPMNSQNQDSISKVCDQIQANASVFLPYWNCIRSSTDPTQFVFLAWDGKSSPLKEARFGALYVNPNGTGVAAAQDVKIEILGVDIDINAMLGACVSTWSGVLQQEYNAIMSNQDMDEIETGSLDDAGNKTAKGALDYIQESLNAANNFMNVYDRYHQSEPTLAALKYKMNSTDLDYIIVPNYAVTDGNGNIINYYQNYRINNPNNVPIGRLGQLPIRKAQINKRMGDDGDFYYQGRATSIVVRIRKRAGTLVDVYRRYLGKLGVAQQNRSTRESIAYWKTKMIVKGLVKNGTGGRYAVAEFSDDEDSYHFDITKPVGLVCDNFNKLFIFSISKSEKILVNSSVNSSGDATKKLANKYELNQKISNSVDLKKNPRLVQILAPIPPKIDYNNPPPQPSAPAKKPWWQFW